jgi:hypothetical protein
MIKSTRREAMKVTIMAKVIERITNNQELKESSTLLGIS